MNKNDYLNSYYSTYQEDARLTATKHGLVEYLTTMKYIHRFLNKGMRILEIGAGTGRYSLALAKEGFRVDAVELLTHNLDILRSKMPELPDGGSIRAYQGDALDLSRFEDGTFDGTLVLGPMYHLYTEEDQRKALQEACRVTKKDGYLFVAYCMSDPTMVGELFPLGEVKKYLEQKKLTEDFHILSEPEDLFHLVRTEDIEKLDGTIDAERLMLVATDGPTGYMRPVIDSMDDDTFALYMRYHFAVCERSDLIGASHHTLDILKKR